MRSAMQPRLHVVGVLLISAGCSSQVPEPGAGVDSGVAAKSAPSAKPSDTRNKSHFVAQPTAGVGSPTIPGYVHSLQKSRFAIGGSPSLEVSVPTLQRWRGGQGAFAQDPTSGWSMAMLDYSAPSGPYILDETQQDPLVQAYFVNAGLPADQIGSVDASFEVGGGGVVGAPSNPQLRSISTILHRQVSGVRVIESYAWAKMMTSGDVGMESVFWPSLDGPTVTAALAFAQDMSDTSKHAGFLAKLPANLREDAGVSIHHTDSSIHASPRTYVSYDVMLEGEKFVRHFDRNGAEFRLPHEDPGGSTATPHP